MSVNKQMGQKYDRSNFFLEINHKMNDGRNVKEYDLGASYFRLFKAINPTRPFQLTKYDANRPDRVSMEVYGVMDYWWIILKFNNIADVFYEFQEGDIIQIPDVQDIKVFLKTVQKKIARDSKDTQHVFTKSGNRSSRT